MYPNSIKPREGNEGYVKEFGRETDPGYAVKEFGKTSWIRGGSHIVREIIRVFEIILFAVRWPVHPKRPYFGVETIFLTQPWCK